MTYSQEEQQHPDCPERFQHLHQVLCKEGLTGRCYWEVDPIGPVNIGVTYKGIGRSGAGDDCRLGFTDRSWSLLSLSEGLSAQHHHEKISISATLSSRSYKVGVYLDWPAGILVFYSFFRHTYPLAFIPLQVYRAPLPDV